MFRRVPPEASLEASDAPSMGAKPHPALRIARYFALLLVVGGGAVFVYELKTSALQAWLFARYVDRLSYALEPGPSEQIAFPSGGPFDERRGYSRIPTIVQNLAQRGYIVSEQVRMSPQLERLVLSDMDPPYREPSAAGLVVRDASGETLYDARRRERAFFDYEDVPKPIVDTLLFIENRELLAAVDPRSNPTLEWDRMAKASLLYVGAKMGLPVSVEGGSTLATQLEKFRHSPQGRTSSAQDKLRQITSASLKAYQYGLDTTRRRREIIVEYLNSMPLAATPGFGEVNGIGEGLGAWFGLGLDDVAQSLQDETAPIEVRAESYLHVLALLAALPAPSTLLNKDRDALRERMFAYLSLMEKAGLIDRDFAATVRKTPLHFLLRAPAPPVTDYVDRKAATAARAALLRMTGVQTHYELGQLDLEVDSAIDTDLQAKVLETFRKLADKDFVAANGFNAKYLLETADPAKVIYGLLLYERTPDGNLLRVQIDTLDQPLDLNQGTKVELGSTAKLRTLTHYLEIVSMLHRDLLPLDTATLRIRARAARDPLTAWVADELSRQPEIDSSAILERALDRRYAANTGEPFFTGGGLRYFTNFDRFEGPLKPTLRVALHNSINLSFVRLMRDIVQFHEAHLPYDSQLIFEDPKDPIRLQLLTEIAEAEELSALRRTFGKYRGKSKAEIIKAVLRNEKRPEKHLRKLTILHYAWIADANAASLAVWLNRWFGPTSEPEVARMIRAYGNPNLNLSDYAYLASRHTLELWCAGKIFLNRMLTWDELLQSSDEAREISSGWLFKDRNVRPQNRRLRIKIEKDTFARMTPYWQRLGFPFGNLVPSYATALGSSGDRPAALAKLLGIILMETFATQGGGEREGPANWRNCRRVLDSEATSPRRNMALAGRRQR
jgi:membrane peptidoglycan carboxypeptidase